MSPILRSALLMATLPVLALSSCTPPEEAPAAGTISREAFIATYVDLRLEALDDTTSMLTPAERATILETHGVVPEDLIRFVEVHGDRPRFMQEIWFEVEERIEQRQDRAASEA